MSNLEIKGQLAKLLATEDLVVEHKQVETAMFNVHTPGSDTSDVEECFQQCC